MLNVISLADAVSTDAVSTDAVSTDAMSTDAMSARMRFRPDALLACDSTSALCGQVGQKPALPAAGHGAGTAKPLPRPQARNAAFLLGHDAQAAGQAEFARQQRTSNDTYAYLTRIAAFGGGAWGPHPARDPV